MKKAQVSIIGWFFLSILCLLACSKDDSGPETVDPQQQEEPDPEVDEEGEGVDSVKFEGFDLVLATGDFWEFYWISEEVNVSQESTAASTDNGKFRITLGDPLTIGGAEAFSVIVGGNNLESFPGPRWNYLAAQDNTLLGSMDGVTLDTIFDARRATWNGGGFFANFDREALIEASEGEIDNEFIATNAIRASYQDGQSICEIIEDERVCANEDTFTLSVDDFFKAGIGPVGYSLRRSTFDQGGGFITSSEYYFEIGLVATSRLANDGFTPSLPPWRELTALPEPFIKTPIAAWDGKIYFFGGLDANSFSTRQIYTYDPIADLWAGQGQTPVELAFLYEENGSTQLIAYEALVVNDKIYFIRTEGPATNPILIYDPTNDSWESGPEIGDLLGTECYITAVGADILFFPIDPFRNGTVSILNSTTGLWSMGNSSPWPHLARSTVSSYENKVYFSGTFRSGAFETRVRVYDYAVPYGEDGAWSDIFFEGEGRADAESQVLNGRLFVMGGDNFGPVMRSVQALDIAQNSWKTVGSMVHPRSRFESVTLDGKIYVIGNGDASNFSIEEYDPIKDRKLQ